MLSDVMPVRTEYRGRTTVSQQSPAPVSLNGASGSEVPATLTVCGACGGRKDRKLFFCLACWRILPRDFRRRLFATRFKPVAHAKVLGDAIAQIKYGEPERTLFDGGKRA